MMPTPSLSGGRRKARPQPALSPVEGSKGRGRTVSKRTTRPRLAHGRFDSELEPRIRSAPALRSARRLEDFLFEQSKAGGRAQPALSPVEGSKGRRRAPSGGRAMTDPKESNLCAFW
jgi:hypothetical protein